MKKSFIIFCAVLLVVCSLPFAYVFSAESDFVIENGVLYSYKGSATNITIPTSAHSIADSAFTGNTKIKTVKFHNTLYSIGNNAFSGCTSLESISGDSAVTYVGALAFSDTKFLKNSDVEFLTVGKVLVSYNGNASAVTLPSTIVSVAPYAFVRNKTITSFSAGDNLLTISEGAFYECTSLANVGVRNSVTYIGPDAFYSTKWLSSKTGFVTLSDGILISYKGSESAVTIPDSVKQIAPNAFYDNQTVTSVLVPSSVTALGERAFYNCHKLSSVSLAQGVRIINDEAFANCTKLSEIIIPRTVSVIGKGAFINCTKLATAVLMGDNLRISYGAFAYCTSLDCVLVSDSVSKIGELAFSNNPKLTHISVPENVSVVYANSFEGSDGIRIICDKGSTASATLSGSCDVIYTRGDACNDGTVDILDATHIQMFIAGIKELPCENRALADADLDANISVMDATCVQIKLAGLSK